MPSKTDAITNAHKAINAKLEILHLYNEITRLQEIIDNNVSIKQMKNPSYVEIDPNRIQASIEEASYVGHKIIYKDVEISLHTNGDERKIGSKIFEAVMKENPC